ncbi:signal peptidase I [Motilibacter deserti]|uniref:Signal peptidase I n=1 Tax=Motilibacter deserti TaxID=2714956 RepID=A0ABX0GWS9_9ACTN|nr:signal peptidase I [Motilibacter deserti]NHC15008.1 signal peptidase I [Motilibacter deserti]
MPPAAVAARVLPAVCRAVVLLVLALGGWGLLAVALGADVRVVVTGSMAPAVTPGTVVVTTAPDRPLAPGQVVVFRRPGSPDETVTHRVVAVLPDGSVQTKGDANAVGDGPAVPRADVVGVARLAIPYVGVPRVWLGTGEHAKAAGVLAGLGALSLIGFGPGMRRGNGWPGAGRPGAGWPESGRRRGGHRGKRRAPAGRSPRDALALRTTV